MSRVKETLPGLYLDSPAKETLAGALNLQDRRMQSKKGCDGDRVEGQAKAFPCWLLGQP